MARRKPTLDNGARLPRLRLPRCSGGALKQPSDVFIRSCYRIRPQPAHPVHNLCITDAHTKAPRCRQNVSHETADGKRAKSYTCGNELSSMAAAARGRPNSIHNEFTFRTALNVALKRPDADGRPYLYRIAGNLVAAALEGEAWAIKEVADRLDGKPAQQLNLEGADNSMRIVVIDATATAAVVAALEAPGAVLGDVAYKDNDDQGE